MHGVTRSIVHELHSWDIQRDQREGESGVSGSIIDELHYSDTQGDQMEEEGGVTRSIIEQLHSWDIQRVQMEGESGVIQSIIDELHSSVSNEIRRNVKAALLEVSFMNFILGISKGIKWRVNESCYSKDH